ncbi:MULTISPECIES: hypothetical protein [unclassified Beijerinckia]|uniref:hypothetical protein n=1 Tax=unclassified Beijerinckia TaxID=2638183 RepID=UPI0008958790|nr:MULTISPECIES: hypothetical protein [unclassified Beijerinckia]MDH7797488.1 hypothetical protein [Beijerinckia sp. GAS462]SEC87654.1 hypothetical protein SAMN05443249_3783 [Beijerinckia sp. 28-YEA-48]
MSAARSIPASYVAFTEADLKEVARDVRYYERCGCKYSWHADPLTYVFTDMGGLVTINRVIAEDLWPYTEAMRAFLWERENG